MASWPERRAAFVQAFEAINAYVQNNLMTDIGNLTTGLANYVQSGGVSNDPSQDPNYAQITQNSQQIQAMKGALVDLNRELSTAIRTHASDNDINGLLAENGMLQQVIQDTQKKKQDTAADAKAAELRDEVLRTREHNVTKHQLFLLGRPLRPGSIPYLWALSALFVGLGLLLVAMTFPTFSVSNELEGMDMTDILSQPAVWGSLLGAAGIVILFLSLNAAGVFKGTS
jgi:hypothetical protein